MFRKCDEILRSGDQTDPDARLLHLHTSHGLAMAKRFASSPEQALSSYRTLSREIGGLFRQLRTREMGRGIDFRDSRGRLVEQAIKTLDRQADCNLFASGGDLKEASDDLRRALRQCHSLPHGKRDAVRAALMHKQALVLCMTSAYQDLDLAEANHKQALALEENLGEEQKKRLELPRRLCAALLAVFKACKAGKERSDDEERRAATRPDRGKALAELRKTIDGLEDAMSGNDIRRDHLEYLLFASRLLVQEGMGCRSRWELQEDVELLLRLCRTVLYKRAEQLPRYLRQYYDTAIRALLRIRPKHVQALLEATWEATTGTPHSKPAMSMPTLAFYALDGQVHAFLDVPDRLNPAGLSKHYALGEDYALERIHEAARARTRLTLPTELSRELIRLKPRLAGIVEPSSGLAQVPANGRDYLVVYWRDPLRGLGRPTDQTAVAQGDTPKYVESLPFALPELPRVVAPARTTVKRDAPKGG
jgi:hypothetical protein